jgi:hypothetical protein
MPTASFLALIMQNWMHLSVSCGVLGTVPARKQIRTAADPNNFGMVASVALEGCRPFGA